MKTFRVCMLAVVIVGLTGCEVTGPSIKVKGPEVKIPGVGWLAITTAGNFVLPVKRKKAGANLKNIAVDMNRLYHAGPDFWGAI